MTTRTDLADAVALLRDIKAWLGMNSIGGQDGWTVIDGWLSPELAERLDRFIGEHLAGVE